MADDKFFEIMQQYEPEDEILTNTAKKEDIERVKFLVFKKKGRHNMKFNIVRKIAIAAVVVGVISGGTVGVNAATDGAIAQKVAELFHVTITTTDSEGNVQKKDAQLKADENGNYTVTVPVEDGESTSISGDVKNSVESATE